MLKNLLNTGIKSPAQHLLLAANNFNAQQIRTTFILKRKYPMLLNKKNLPPRPLRARDYVYDLIEDTNVKKHPDVEVILTSYVSGIGKKGDIVKVSPSYAYNKLLLPGLAAYVTPQTVEKYVNLDDSVKEETYSSPFALRTMNMIQNKVFSIVMNQTHPWVIEPWHIRVSLRKAGFNILHDSSIELPKEKITGPDLTIQNKGFSVVVTINNTEKVEVKCKIHHWTRDPDIKLPYVFEHYKLPVEPIPGVGKPESLTNTIDK
ncbi:CLUMA_CG002113, isoform A [Clunio marinus]|uniref:Large ribosomal subunit protein bL9m n=1 Tax=Clunio marinus TaxID=568069 RepID=A0A1J1HPD0_9DIPT|nr:CLUMA_CG002113, isoform A [Clunio marinus]